MVIFYNNDNLSGFDLVVRSGDQVNDMDEEELHSLFESSDAFIGEWISTDVDSVLTSLLTKYPEVSNKELFLILEKSGVFSNDEIKILLEKL